MNTRILVEMIGGAIIAGLGAVAVFEIIYRIGKLLPTSTAKAASNEKLKVVAG
jgi:hypothetical protein